ncbi:MAG: hypothetical protein HFG02_00300 [Oscillibacter sp.]|nr:hypothetical protein [Oscillibacter sp.]
MENYSFKTVAFGGFDKQDVARYLEQSSEKAAAEQRELEREIEELRRQAAEQAEKVEQLESEVGRLNVQRDWLQSQLDTETATRKDLESLRSLEQDIARVSAEADALRPDAEAYARFRERLGSIECEARNRADDLEDAAAERTRRTMEMFQSQYQDLMGLFHAATSRITRELQEIEAALTQLPRNMDETETALNALAASLQKGPDGRALFLSGEKQETAPTAQEPAFKSEPEEHTAVEADIEADCSPEGDPPVEKDPMKAEEPGGL